MSNKLLPVSEFSRNVLTLVSGTAIAQAIPLLISPILSRLFDARDFGEYAMFLSIGALLIVANTGRYHLAVVLPRQAEEAANLVALSLIFTLAFTVITVLVSFLFHIFFPAVLVEYGVAGWLFFLPVFVLLSGVNQTYIYWMNRKKEYKKIAYSKMIQQVVIAVFSIGLGYFVSEARILILAVLLGLLASDIYMLSLNWMQDRNLLRSISRVQMMKQARKHKDFLKINTPHAFVDVIQSSGTIFLISYFFSKVILGFYSFAIKVLRTPFTLLGQTIGQVFYQKAATMYAEGEDIQPLVRKLMLTLLIISLPIYGLLMLKGPVLFAFIFGEQWREAGVYAQILSPWLLLTFVASSLSHIPLIVNKQKQMFRISLIGNSMILLSIVYGGLIAEDIKSGFILLSALLTIYLILLLRWIYQISKSGA